MPRYPLKYLAPNAITCASVTLGIVSVFHAMNGEYTDAAWFILMCVLFDKADGSVARLLNASSEFGIQLDSFSDFITFGIAPGFLIHGLLTDPTVVGSLYLDRPELMGLLRVSVIVFVLASCLRLAKFNVLTERIGGGMFLGFPTTLCGALLGSYILTSLKYEWPVASLQILPLALFVLSYLMVSNIRLPKARLPRAQPYRTAMIGIIASIYVCGLSWTAPEYLLLIGVSFLSFGIVYGAIYLEDAVELPPMESEDDESAVQTADKGVS